jgi:NitT/TauT family transport system substrate-binding protein
MTGRQQWAVFGTALVISAAVAVYFMFAPARRPAGPPMEITLAVTTNSDSALVHVAQLKGYFKDEGLAVTTLTFTSGKAALEAVLRGEAQIATVAETPIVLNILKGEALAVIAGIFHSDRNMGVVARRDRGISTPSDLRGKNIGTPLGTNAHYFFHAFHTVEGIPESDVTLTGMAPEATVEALLSGQVDAVAVWNPFLLVLRKKLGGDGVSFFSEHVYTYTFNLAAKRNFAAANQPAIAALLRALLKAESSMRDEPAEARRAVAEFSGWDSYLLDELWDDYSFRVSLDQALLVNMESQARWAIDTGLAPPSSQLNFLDAMYLDGLQAVAPARITIAH